MLQQNVNKKMKTQTIVLDCYILIMYHMDIHPIEIIAAGNMLKLEVKDEATHSNNLDIFLIRGELSL